MLSKCANPECSETLRYLHEGKIFCLALTPEVQTATGMLNPPLEERFWLCERCSKEMTLIWGGTQVKLVPLPIRKGALPLPPASKSQLKRRRPRARAASSGREDR
jgi:hypothetical protein